MQDTTLYDTHAAHTQFVANVSVHVSSCQLSKSRGSFCPLFERFLKFLKKRLNAFCTLFKSVQTESCIVQGHATFVSSKRLSIAFHSLIQLALSYRTHIFKVFLSTGIKSCIAPKCRLCFQKWEKWAV
jgi:hypothetical protein